MPINTTVQPRAPTAQRLRENIDQYNFHYLYSSLFLIFVTASDKNRTGFQADVTATSLMQFALTMTAEAVEKISATYYPRNSLNSIMV